MCSSTKLWWSTNTWSFVSNLFQLVTHTSAGNKKQSDWIISTTFLLLSAVKSLISPFLFYIKLSPTIDSPWAQTHYLIFMFLERTSWACECELGWSKTPLQHHPDAAACKSAMSRVSLDRPSQLVFTSQIRGFVVGVLRLKFKNTHTNNKKHCPTGQVQTQSGGYSWNHISHMYDTSSMFLWHLFIRRAVPGHRHFDLTRQTTDCLGGLLQLLLCYICGKRS